MAVEIIRNKKNNAEVEILYQFSKDEKLSMISPLHYTFQNNTRSNIKCMDKIFIPKNIYITPKIHKSNTLDQDCEMIVETLHKDTQPLFICVGLKFETDLQNSQWIFPLKSANLESIISQCSRNDLYETKGKNIVCVCSKSLLVNGVKPPITASAKDMYNNIIDVNAYDVLSLINSAGDAGIKKVESKTSNATFKKQLFKIEENVQEGFLTNNEGNEDDTYMECKLLEEDATDANEVYEDVAVVPLKTNTYERSISMFTHLLHFFLIIFGGIIIMPFLFITLFTRKSFYTNDSPNVFSTIIRYFSTVAFFAGGIVMMILGLSQNKYDTSKNLNYNKMTSGMLMTIIGLYFVVFHLCFSIGMFGWKMIEFDKFGTMFTKSDLGIASCFDILDGMFEVKLST